MAAQPDRSPAVADTAGTTPGPGSRWAGVPAAERRIERRRLLLEAALALLGDGGGDAVTVRAVCGTARLNPRYFYESFADRAELLVALYDDVITLLATEIRTALGAATDLDSAVRAGVDTVFRFVAADPRRASILYTDAIDIEPIVRRRIAATEGLIQAINQPAAAAAALERMPAVEPIDVVTASMFTGGMNEVLLGWLGGRIEQSLDDLIDEAVDLGLALIAAGRRPPT